MRVIILLLTVVAVALSFNLEDLDIEKLVKNDNRREAAFACLMDQQPCGEFQELRDTIPIMIKTRCEQCTPKQKQKYEQVSKVLVEKYPEIFNALVSKYSAPPH